jgi:lactoylglutathione lyase
MGKYFISTSKKLLKRMSKEIKMTFCWATIYVKNMEESLRFYQDVLGLQLNRRTNPSPEMELAFLGSGDTQIELICNAKNSDISFGKNISLGFVAESIESITELLKVKNIAILSGPFQPNPSIKFIYILDPNGLKIQFVENIK